MSQDWLAEPRSFTASRSFNRATCSALRPRCIRSSTIMSVMHACAVSDSVGRLSTPPLADLHVQSPHHSSMGFGDASHSASPASQNPQVSSLSYLESMLVLTQGATMVKYASKRSLLSSLAGVGGQPVTRFVFFDKEQSGDMGAIYWCKEGRRVKDHTRCIRLKHVTGLYEQAETAAFAGRTGSSLTAAARACCFSIVTKDRTLDLQASSVAQRNTWMHAIHQILLHSGYNVHEMNSHTGVASASSPNPGNAASPTSASATAMETAQRLDQISKLQIDSPGGNNVSAGAPTPSPAASTMLSPPAHASFAPLQSPQPAGCHFTPANTPMQKHDHVHAHANMHVGLSGRATPEPSLPAEEDPLAKAKLHHSLSPGSAASLTLTHDPEREIPASLRFPPGEDSSLPVAHAALSPSEHPTQTPACSPVVRA